MEYVQFDPIGNVINIHLADIHKIKIERTGEGHTHSGSDIERDEWFGSVITQS